MRNSQPSLWRDLHFDLSYLGSAHETCAYTLRAGGCSYPMRRHTGDTLRESGFDPETGLALPTHFARAVESGAGVVQLVEVLGPPAPNGFPTLASIVVSTPNGTTSYSVSDVAQAVVFMNPTVSVLIPDAAERVLGHIAGTGALPGLSLAIMTAGTDWTSPRPVLDDDGKPVLNLEGVPYYTYELAEEVLNSTAPVSGQSKAASYSDDALDCIRWNFLPGVSHLNMSPGTVAPGRGVVAAGNAGYRINVEDGGPNFGICVTVNGLDEDLNLDLTVTNTYIRHVSVFVNFLDTSGKEIVVPDNIWIELAKFVMKGVVTEWLEVADDSDARQLLALLGNNNNTLKWCGNVGPENTFMGVPVASASNNFVFTMPSDGGPVGRIRLLAGTMGVDSGNDWDPVAAWLGLAMTAVIDLTIPTFALIATVGVESNTLFDSIFKDVKFLLPTAFSVFTVAKDIFGGSASTGSDLRGALISLADRLVGKVLTASDVAAKLAAYFGAEAVQQAIPYAGWALKVLAMEATVEQLAQTIGEVIASPRVVEFDLTVTMNAQIRLTPDPSTGGEFPATATTFTITAQYSGNTTRVYTGIIGDIKVSSILVDWADVPVGGTVTFVVAMYSEEGWGVGKGQSATVANVINAQDANGVGILAAAVTVQQQLYPLGPGTTYKHNQVLRYVDDISARGYTWQATAQAPAETAEDLGSGPAGHVLQSLNGITLSDDLGILGYGWEASGLNIPPVNDDDNETELYTFQNISFKPAPGNSSPWWPQAGYMTAPAGYPKPPILVYLRTATEAGEDLAGPGFFFLDPTGDSESGFHLRRVTPVTDMNVAITDPSRQFDLRTGLSWGRFALLPTSVAIHSNGYVVAVNPRSHNMQILKLASQGTPDAAAPWAFSPLGPGTGVGRLGSPVLAAIRPDQTILILEAGNQRIQAFSRGGHPVPAFSEIATPYWIPLEPHAPDAMNVVHLSMSTDVAGYVYLLSQAGNGYDPADFNLDIFTPTGQHLVSQRGLVAAGLAVDLWRNVYTLNFQQISGIGGRTEPSISEYIPSTPRDVRTGQPVGRRP